MQVTQEKTRWRVNTEDAVGIVIYDEESGVQIRIFKEASVFAGKIIDILNLATQSVTF